MIKRVFGFTKVRYRGLLKNGHRLVVASALANLFMMRTRLLRLHHGRIQEALAGCQRRLSCPFTSH